MTYLRTTVAEWDVDVDTSEGSRLVDLATEAGRVLVASDAQS